MQIRPLHALSITGRERERDRESLVAACVLPSKVSLSRGGKKEAMQLRTIFINEGAGEGPKLRLPLPLPLLSLRLLRYSFVNCPFLLSSGTDGGTNGGTDGGMDGPPCLSVGRTTRTPLRTVIGRLIRGSDGGDNWRNRGREKEREVEGVNEGMEG